MKRSIHTEKIQQQKKKNTSNSFDTGNFNLNWRSRCSQHLCISILRPFSINALYSRLISRESHSISYFPWAFFPIVHKFWLLLNLFFSFLGRKQTHKTSRINVCLVYRFAPICRFYDQVRSLPYPTQSISNLFSSMLETCAPIVFDAKGWKSIGNLVRRNKRLRVFSLFFCVPKCLHGARKFICVLASLVLFVNNNCIYTENNR